MGQTRGSHGRHLQGKAEKTAKRKLRVQAVAEFSAVQPLLSMFIIGCVMTMAVAVSSLDTGDRTVS